MLNRHFALLATAFALALGACNCGAQKAAVKHPKKLGEACTGNSDCESALCGAVPGVDGGAGGTTTCQQGCNSSTTCGKNQICVDLNQKVDGSEAYACEADPGDLCHNCTTDAECGYPGDACIRFDTVTSCGRDCSGDGKCPLGFTCTDAFRANGTQVSKQCVPTSGTCACTETNRGMTRACSNHNGYGTCKGVETCDPSQNGFVGCDALTPRPETCNGVDDDCNGVVDDVPEPTVTCGSGPCQVTVASCVDGGTQTCTPDLSKASPETCDGIDNDCNGQVDDNLGTHSCGFGPCQVTVAACANGAPVACSPDMTKATAEVCDGIDNDCNGLADDNLGSSTCGSGPCQVTVQNCVGGQPQACTPDMTKASTEMCDGIDNDCNGLVDDNLGVTVCGFGPCMVTVQNCVDGGAQFCVPDMTKASTEVCNGVDDNCNGTIDDGFVLNDDVANCGRCGNQCSTFHDTPTCVLGQCVLSCDQGFDNCDQDAGTGCEANLNTDNSNCGVCGRNCNTVGANATGTCQNGTCVLTCQTGYVDADHDPSNGCECHKLSNTDLPDTNFVDANCDGIDGEVAKGMFVDKATGDDTNGDGSMAHPFKTVQKGIDEAFNQGKRDVYIGLGTYNSSTSLQMRDGISLYGGYDASNNWSRAAASGTTTLSGSVTPVLAQNVSDVTLQLLSIFGQAATGAGQTAIAVRVENSTNVSFDTVSVKAGNGANGADGAQGSQGATGPNGSDGDTGIEDDGINGDYFACDNCGFTSSTASTCTGPQGGAGARNNSCTSANGGKGGGAGWAASSGQSGQPSAANVAGGLPVASGRGNTPAGATSNGHVGGAGGDGSDGSGGASFGTISLSGYTPADGTAGVAGTPGQGGGGGGGGGGGTVDCWSWGGGGGGGGAGGCGGQPGTVGHGGGASIALWLVSSDVNATASTFTAGHGGQGGAGGAGGPGGPGGAGGGSPYNSSSTQDDGSLGGVGGHGGAGGKGGRAGGGGGGPSVGMASFSSSFNPDATTTVVAGAGGVGGANGFGGNAATGDTQSMVQQ